MKTQLYFLLIIVILSSCKKGVGTVHYKIKFTTNEIIVKDAKSLITAKSVSEDLYTNFGEYITSLTPAKFTAKIWTIGLLRRSNSSK